MVETLVRYQEKAQFLGINSEHMGQTELIHAIQTTEGYSPCFGMAQGTCSQSNCCFIQDCVGVGTSQISPKASPSNKAKTQKKATEKSSTPTKRKVTKKAGTKKKTASKKTRKKQPPEQYLNDIFRS